MRHVHVHRYDKYRFLAVFGKLPRSHVLASAKGTRGHHMPSIWRAVRGESQVEGSGGQIFDSAVV